MGNLLPKVSLVLGGARSGKSSFAEKLVRESGLEQVYFATSQLLDDEMADRIAHHRARRGADWHLIEEPLALADKLTRTASGTRCILVDCLTLWLTNVMVAERDVKRECEQLCAALSGLAGSVVLVSNEVGQGIVPVDKMAREFRDHAGRLHQMIAEISDAVWFVTAGLPQKLK